jgi:MtaA/CmuA family methyltransferase
MNSFERMQARLKGQAVDRPPNFNIYMTLAAHHIGRPLSAYYRDYRTLVAANMAVLETYEPDIVQAISDPFRETADFGAKIEFPEDDLPICRRALLADPDDIRWLTGPEPGSGRRMSDRLEAVRAFREQVGGQVPVMGWVEGALAQAADLRGVMDLMADLILRPEWVEELLAICVEVEIAFAQAQVAAGADIVGLGDAVASLVSPAMYRRFALPYEQRIFAAVHEMGALARLHICGDTSVIVDDMVESGADIIDLDWMVDMGAAAAKHGREVSFCGNFDPVTVMLQGKPEQVYAATQECMAAGGNRSFSAAGCEIPDGSPPANLLAQNRALRELD